MFLGPNLQSASELRAYYGVITLKDLVLVECYGDEYQGLKNIGSMGAALPGRLTSARKFSPKLLLISGC